MKTAINKLQAMINSAIPLDEHNKLENLSLQMKIQSELSQPENSELKIELQHEESQEVSITRLRTSVQSPTTEEEVLH